ncbi:hypothetical protein AgCh_004892 [Apium graveolens]
MLENHLENVSIKLVRQDGAKTNDLAGYGFTTYVLLAHGLIAKGVKVIAARMNPIHFSRGTEKTSLALIFELKSMSGKVEKLEIADVAFVSALGTMVKLDLEYLKNFHRRRVHIVEESGVNLL